MQWPDMVLHYDVYAGRDFDKRNRKTQPTRSARKGREFLWLGP